MKLNDMTIADIIDAAEANSEKYEKHWQNFAKSAFREGACWAYNYLLQKGNEFPWCNQSIDQ